MEHNKKGNPDEQQREENQDKQSSKSGNAANLDAIISSPTDAVRSRRHTDTWSNQGTNTSYEGQTAPPGQGSAGTGQGSGQSATGARITTSDAYDHATGNRDEKQGEDLLKPDEQGDELDRDTMGTP
jgi:hypothetical protein